MSTTTSSDHPRFSRASWAEVSTHGVGRQCGSLPWTHLHDLGVELAERDDNRLTFKQARDLVSAAAHGLPIELTWTDSSGFRARAIVVVKQLFPTHAHHSRWGFDGPIWLAEVDAVVVPEATYDSPTISQEN